MAGCTRPTRNPCDDRSGFVHSRQLQIKKEWPDMTEAAQRTKFTAGRLTFVVKHELWDGNIHDHADQGVSIEVKAELVGKETALLQFNCFDFEKSYIYGPENAELAVAGPEMLGGDGADQPLPHGCHRRWQPDR